MFEDGSVENGTLLIGAEGAHSMTRNWLLASSPQDAAMRHLPISCFATLTKLSHETALSMREINPAYCLTVDPNGLMTFVSLHDCRAQDPADWTFMLLITWAMDETDDHAALANDSDLLLDKVRALAEPLAYPFKAVVRDVPRGIRTWYTSRLSYWPTMPWDSRGGRVTLAGDAAHAMTFHRGQGLGNVITDAAELQTHLRAMKAQTRDELAAAVDKYEREVWQRGRQVVMENKENTMALHDWEMVSQSPIMVAGARRYTSQHAAEHEGSS